MKTMLPSLLIGVIAGAILALVIVFYSSPSIMFKENKSNYDFQTTVTEFEKSVLEAGWKIPHVNDLQETMRKFGKDVRQVKVMEVCQPELAYQILSQDDERIVSSMMPCRVAIYERTDGTVYISRMNSGLLSKPMNKLIRTTMSEAAGDIEKILDPHMSK